MVFEGQIPFQKYHCLLIHISKIDSIMILNVTHGHHLNISKVKKNAIFNKQQTQDAPQVCLRKEDHVRIAQSMTFKKFKCWFQKSNLIKFLTLYVSNAIAFIMALWRRRALVVLDVMHISGQLCNELLSIWVRLFQFQGLFTLLVQVFHTTYS